MQNRDSKKLCKNDRNLSQNGTKMGAQIDPKSQKKKRKKGIQQSMPKNDAKQKRSKIRKNITLDDLSCLECANGNLLRITEILNKFEDL